MPVTKTAKRALRSSNKKVVVNKSIMAKLEIAIRVAKRNKKPGNIQAAISLADRAAKKKVIHKNKAARIKSSLAKLAAVKKPSKAPKKTKSPKKK